MSILQDLENYAGPDSVREWKKLLVSSTFSLYQSCFIDAYLECSLYLSFEKLLLFYSQLYYLNYSVPLFFILCVSNPLWWRMQFFQCQQQQWLYLLCLSEVTWVFFPLLLPDMHPPSWNLLLKWDLRGPLVQQSFSDPFQKLLIHWA